MKHLLVYAVLALVAWHYYGVYCKGKKRGKVNVQGDYIVANQERT